MNVIREKSKFFANTDSAPGIEAVIHHIEVAENHFEGGKSYGEYLYTDVIYRTNQAFEGALKEAFRVFTGKNPSGISPYDIEQYLEKERLLRERVLAQFRTYRKQWRNKSTHDYQLFFSSQEALLAIVSISAFFSILLDQMLERHAHDMEQQKLRKRSYSFVLQVPNYKQLDFLDQSVELVRHFAVDLKEDSLKSLSEYEIQGKLSGFIEQADPGIKVTADRVIHYGQGIFRPDLILEKRDKSVVIELSRPSLEWARRAREGLLKMRSYLEATGATEGIVFVPPRGEQSVEVQKKTVEFNEKEFQIVLIVPSRNSST